MKSWLWKGMLAAAIALPALSGVARAQSNDNDGCTNATLKGDYAFGVTAYTPPGLPDGPPRVVVGIKTFDGRGKFTQRDYIGDSLRTTGQTDFSTGETGTYAVNSDCRAAWFSTITCLTFPRHHPGRSHKHRVCDQQRRPSYPRSRRKVHTAGIRRTPAHPNQR